MGGRPFFLDMKGRGLGNLLAIGLVLLAIPVVVIVLGRGDRASVEGMAGERGAQMADQGGQRPAAAPADSIAVLAFDNLSGDPSQDYFSDGVSEELRSALSRIAQLRVAARTSSTAFKNSNADAAAIGAKLAVAYILDGSVRRSGNKVRVGVQLIDAKTGLERWSQSYDRDMADILAVQASIANAVADALKIKLAGDFDASLGSGGTTNVAAHDHFLRGKALADRNGSEAEWRAALAEFDRAIAADPNYALAYAGRARALVAIANAFAPAAEVRRTFDEAVDAARRAVELAPGSAQTQAALGFVLTNARLDVGGARIAYDTAYKIAPGDAEVLSGYGRFAARYGDQAAGLAALRKAVELDPLNPRAYANLGIALYFARQYAAAIPPLTKALELSPSMSMAHAWRGSARLQLGQMAAAEADFAAEPLDWARYAAEAIAAHRTADRAGADAAFARLTALGDDTAYQQAQVLAQWGETQKALDMLELADRLGDSGLGYLSSDPMLDPLRAEPRFKALEKRLTGAA